MVLVNGVVKILVNNWCARRALRQENRGLVSGSFHPEIIEPKPANE